VKDKHDLARDAFVGWVLIGNHELDRIHFNEEISCTIKLSVRHCKQHEDTLRADACAASLTNKDYNKFWQSINKMSNNKSTQFATAVGEALVMMKSVQCEAAFPGTV